jgi:hypothetical protein
MSSRELLERRRSPGRVVAVIGGMLALLLGTGAALALWLLPPVLAGAPRERLTVSDAAVTVQDATTSATVTFGEGWLLLGVGPFLPTDAQTLVSPDDAYRLVLTLEPAAQPSDATAPTSPVGLEPEALDALLARTGVVAAEHGPAVGNGSATDRPPTDAAPTDAAPTDAAPTETAPTDAAPTDAAASGTGSSGAAGAAGAAAEWSHETLASGATVSFADVVHGDHTTTVALVVPAGLPAGAPALALIATVATADTARYRTVTADLASTVTVTPGPTGPSTPDGSVPPSRGGGGGR